MARALISPNEPRTVGDRVGSRVAQVEMAEFVVAPPLFWATCNSSIVADQWMYVDNQFVKIPEIILPGPANPVGDEVIDTIREF